MNEDQKKRLTDIIKWMYYKFFRDRPNLRGNSSWFAYLKKRSISTNGDYGDFSSDTFFKIYKNDSYVLVEQPGFGARWAAIPIEYARQILEFEEQVYFLGDLP
jgi:hypothetical protein